VAVVLKVLSLHFLTGQAVAILYLAQSLLLAVVNKQRLAVLVVAVYLLVQTKAQEIHLQHLHHKEIAVAVEMAAGSMAVVAVAQALLVLYLLEAQAVQAVLERLTVILAQALPMLVVVVVVHINTMVVLVALVAVEMVEQFQAQAKMVELT
jgi:hypothetical protein